MTVQLCENQWDSSDPQQLDDLNIFKCISVPQPLACLSGLRSEHSLLILLALAQDLHAEYFKMNDILSFFCAHQRELPTWSYFACVLATQQANSASVERVFSILKQAFKETQEKSLGDYVYGVVMRRYNKRREQSTFC